MKEVDVIHNVESVERLVSVLSNADGGVPVLSLVCLHASWTTQLHCRQDPSALAKIFNDAVSYLDFRSNLTLKAFMLQVDHSDEMLDLCISDNQHKQNHPNDDYNAIQMLHDLNTKWNSIHINCPEQLPALMVIAYQSEKGYTVTQVPLDSNDLLACLNYYCTKNDKSTNGQEMKDVHELMIENTTSTVVTDDTKLETLLQSAVRKVLSDQIHLLLKRSHESQEMNTNMFSDIPIKTPLRIFIAGDRSQVGKSSVCLGLLGSLLQIYPASKLAYIKPATQCEQPQLVSKYCDLKGIQAIPVGPLVYYRGFTRSFLNHETESSQELLQLISNAVDDIALNKDVIIIDGVGYPSVGSITGTDNAAVALASGYLQPDGSRLPPSVLIVGKSGVGDAVDSYNLNATYFRGQKIPILGAIFNKLSLDGYYSLENCKQAVSSYFEQNSNQTGGEQVYGFIPELKDMMNEEEQETQNDAIDPILSKADMFISAFLEHVNVKEMLIRASQLKDLSLNESSDVLQSRKKRVKLNDTTFVKQLNNSMSRVKLTRDQIEGTASASGAPSG
jgi:hypothetical protein